MRAPEFWSRSPDAPGWLARTLSPLGAVWHLGNAWRRWRAMPVRAPVPVLCVGNLTAGGGGKSPMVAALMQRLSARGIEAHVISRGYGGSSVGPHRVDPERDDHQAVGDEPLMLAATGPVWVSRDRAAGALAAAEAGARLILLDDGYQNPGLIKDASILMIDAGQGFGNGLMIPAGPLREPVSEGLARADLAVLVGSEAARDRVLAQWPKLAKMPYLGATLSPLRTGLPLSGAPVVAFAGIARPEKFFETLRGLGSQVIATHPFGDHEPYTPQVLRRLIAEARGANALLVTTEKDAVRLPETMRQEVLTVQVQLQPTDWAPIDTILDRLLR